jgi:hypothetical protein
MVTGDPSRSKAAPSSATAAPAPGHAYYDGPFWNHAFTNFELRVDVMARPNSNGGL